MDWWEDFDLLLLHPVGLRWVEPDIRPDTFLVYCTTINLVLNLKITSFRIFLKSFLLDHIYVLHSIYLKEKFSYPPGL